MALAGATGVSSLLDDLRANLTSMSSSSLTTAQRDILSSDFNELMSQAGNFILDASFNNMNLLTNSADNVTTLSNLSGSSLTSRRICKPPLKLWRLPASVRQCQFGGDYR